MFRDALLESSPALRRRNGWPMATAFTLQMIVASVLVLVPLISTGVLPISKNLTPVWMPSPPAQQNAPRGTTAAGGGPTFHAVEIVQLISTSRQPIDWNLHPTATQEQVSPWTTIGPGDNSNAVPASLFDNAQPIPPVKPKPLRISHSMDAMLLNKVIPVYPAIARIAGVQGDVLLHAIISKDGTIESLTVTSGPAMLRQSALQAVQQWRYKPYLLNGQAVEVETVITVSFKRS